MLFTSTPPQPMKNNQRQRKLELRRAIAKINKPYPKDDLIGSYADFLQVRYVLRYYKFNPVVFDSLVKLADELWSSDKRISRISLLKTISAYQPSKNVGRYNQMRIEHQYDYSIETKKLLFSLFRRCYEESDRLTENQVEEARMVANRLIINVGFETEEEEWLCKNHHLSNAILNRVLRYPIKSDVITDWVKANFHNSKFITRRAELISWLLDKDPNYEVETQTLIDDFEHLNEIDLKAIKNYKEELNLNRIFEEEFDEYWFEKYGETRIPPNEGGYHADYDVSEPKLELTKRPYIPSSMNDRGFGSQIVIPDFKKISMDFYDNLTTHHKMTMIWSITYSRLDIKVKNQLYKKYYSDATYYTMYKVCERLNNSALLKWMLKMQDEVSITSPKSEKIKPKYNNPFDDDIDEVPF